MFFWYLTIYDQRCVFATSIPPFIHIPLVVHVFLELIHAVYYVYYV